MARRHQVPARGYKFDDQELEALAIRLRRLAEHRGYDRRLVASPMLQRLMPHRKLGGTPATQIIELRHRLVAAALDDNARTYLMDMVEAELDYARLRLLA